jgi:hypothetical protein
MTVTIIPDINVALTGHVGEGVRVGPGADESDDPITVILAATMAVT